MPRRIATVIATMLTPRGPRGEVLAPIALATPAWQAWLADPANRSFAFEGDGGGLTARREPRSGVDYWYAYRTIAGRLRKVYLGRSADLTLARLEAAAHQLSAERREHVPASVPAPLVTRPTLATRLLPPPLRAGCIPRPRLDQLLDAGLSGALVLLVAPAGFGKTTLLAALAERHQANGTRQAEPKVPDAVAFTFSLLPASPAVAWLSLAPEDDHPAQLLRDMVAAFRTIVPGLGTATLATLDAGDAPDTAAALLVNELAATVPPALLVLDEYHLLQAPEAHALVSFLLEHRPPALHLVIAAREQPPLSLARLRVRGLIRELGAGELRFTLAESAAWLRSQVSPDLTDAELAALEARTEGWAAAIQLATLALRGRPDPGALIAALAGSERLVADYLAEEVLAGLNPTTYVFVLRTSILEQLCAGLCAAVLATDDPRPLQLLLEELERRNLFLHPLDAERRWFRFHPLFAAVLRGRLARELDPQAMAALHRSAAEWLAAAGLAVQAIAHALIAGEHQLAGRLIATRSLSELLGAIPQATVHAWLAALPAEAVRANPRLCLLQSWVLLERHDLAGSAEWLGHAEAARTPDAPAGADAQSEIVLLDLAGRLFRGDARNVAAAQLALERLPARDGELAALLQLLIALATFTSGAWAQAHAGFVAIGRQARQAGNRFLHVAAGVSQACVELAQGDLPAVVATCRRLRSLQPEGGLVGDFNLLLRLLAQEVAREQGVPLDPAEVVGLAAAAAQLGDVDARILAGALLVRTALSCGDGDLAQREAEALTRLAEGERRPLVAETAAALCALAALQRGDSAGATGWLQTAPTAALPDRMLPLIGVFLWEPCILAPIQLGLAHARESGDRTVWQAVRDQVARAEAGTQLTCGLRVRLCTLRTLAHGAMREYRPAFDALREAMTLAAPGSFVAPFREAAPELLNLAAELRRSGAGRPEDAAALYQLSRLLGEDGTDLHQDLAAPTAGTLALDGLVEPLTPRERDVLALLAEGASNRAIAARLILSEGTVKGYVHTILGKLGARSRTEAAAQARALGLLDP